MEETREESGYIIVVLAFSIVLLLAFAAMAVDSGILYTAQTAAQRAADAAALAGNLELCKRLATGPDAVVIVVTVAALRGLDTAKDVDARVRPASRWLERAVSGGDEHVRLLPAHEQVAVEPAGVGLGPEAAGIARCAAFLAGKGASVAIWSDALAEHVKSGLLRVHAIDTDESLVKSCTLNRGCPLHPRAI